MTSGFKVLVHRDGRSLHLKLMGDFDAGNADELIRLLKRNSGDARRVFIHTSCLKSIDASVLERFQKALDELHVRSNKILFTGENTGLIAPAKSMHN